MEVSIRDADALRAVTPAALSAYARAAGWSAQGRYRVHSDVYVGEGKPEIIIPRTERLGDYASIVGAMIETFAQVAEQDELTVYRSLVTADRDVVRVRVGESDDGSVALNAAAELIGGARDMLLSAACSLGDRRPVYRAGANGDAAELVERMRLGQIDQGSFVVTLLTPVVPPPMHMLLPDSDNLNAPIQRRPTRGPIVPPPAPMSPDPDDPDDPNAPIQRRMTRRLIEALNAAHEMVERTVAGEEGGFGETVASGVSANLCEAVARIVEPFSTLDVGISWARTRPMSAPEAHVRFGRADAAILREAARSFRERAPEPDARVYGFVRVSKRDQADVEGTVRLVADVDGRQQVIVAVLEREDYHRAVQAHRDKALVVLAGDLDRVGQRWQLRNPHLKNVISPVTPDASRRSGA